MPTFQQGNTMSDIKSNGRFETLLLFKLQHIPQTFLFKQEFVALPINHKICEASKDKRDKYIQENK